VTEDDRRFLELSELQQQNLYDDDAEYFYTRCRIIKIADFFDLPIERINQLSFENRCTLSDSLREIYLHHMINGIVKYNQSIDELREQLKTKAKAKATQALKDDGILLYFQDEKILK
jgi:hypothetical protein